MYRNTVIGLILIVGILIGYSIWTRPSKEQVAKEQHRRDSIALVNQAEKIRLAEEIKAAEQLALQNTTINSVDSTKKQQYQDMLGVFAGAAEDTTRFLIMENNLMKVTFSTKGGRPYSVELKDYKEYDGAPLILFSGDSTVFGLNFFAQNRSIATNSLYFVPQTQESHLQVNADSAVLRMRLNAGDNAYIEYCYTMKSDDYMMGFDINMVNMSQYMSGNRTGIDFAWQVYSPRHEKGAENENNYTQLFYRYHQDDVESLSQSKDEQKKISTRLDWISFKQQFFSWNLIAKESFANADIQSQKLTNQTQHIKKYDALIGMAYEPGLPQQTIPMSMYFGPNHYKTLKKYDIGLENLVPLGKNIIRWINRFVIIPLFDWLGGFINSYGLIILLMTIIIKVGLMPLTFKSFMSSAKMRVLKPQIDEINQRIPKDKAMERQQAVMALYKKAGVSPMGGCLPMLLQMPILIAMFRFFPASIELRQQSFLWATDLSTYDSIFEWDTYIPIISQFYGNHISLFTLLMTVATMISMKMSSGQTDTSAMPGMKTMMYIMPVMFMFFLNNYSSGLTYYYFLANVITITQNEIFKLSIDEEKILKRIQANKAKPVKKSKFQQRIEAMQKQQQSMSNAKTKKK